MTEKYAIIDDNGIKSSVEKKHTTLIKLFSKSTENVLKKRNLLIR